MQQNTSLYARIFKNAMIYTTLTSHVIETNKDIHDVQPHDLLIHNPMFDQFVSLHVRALNRTINFLIQSF